MASYINTMVDEISRSLNPSAKVEPKDITVCVAIRASEVNPWVLNRLKFMLQFYNPAPKFLIIDFGSEERYAEEIRDICNSSDSEVAYQYIDDKGVFSLSTARNACLSYVDTDLMFFTDIDVVQYKSFFGYLAELSTDLELLTAIRRPLFMPVYHVNRKASNEFEELDNNQKNLLLRSLGYLGQGTAFKDIFEFVAPYCNVFLIHKDFFDLSGGYCSDFRGHGSEDFEFLVRLGILSSSIPLPDSLNKDFFGPLKGSFWGGRDYVGFRRYLEALTVMTENLGLSCFHMWHEKPIGKGYWTDSNDWKRNVFNEVISLYYPKLEGIIEVDYLPRRKKALCLFNDVGSWGYFLPLRLKGYSLTKVTAVSDSILNSIYKDLENFCFQEVFIFNPYMKSHAKYRGIIEVAKSLGIKCTIIERGGLPNSIYYADEVVYGDPIYKKLDSIMSVYECQNQTVTENIIERIRSGNDVLESQDTYEDTRSRNKLLAYTNKNIFFIPLQLHDDMAVTKFTEGYITYQEFYDEILEVVSNNPDDLFIIKQHPLSKARLESTVLDNLIIASDKDNIHCLIDISSATIVYNSGVGLLSCIHNKPTFNIGNAYYSSKTLSRQVHTLSEAIALFKSEDISISKYDILKYLDWLIYERYSWFTAESIIREFSDRKSHGYKNIVVEIINLSGDSINCGSRNVSYPFSKKSYIGWKTSMNYVVNKTIPIQPKTIPAQPKNIIKKASSVKQSNDKKEIGFSHKVPKDTFMARQVTKSLSLFLSERKKKKLKEYPENFFKDSKSKFIKLCEKICMTEK